MSEKIQLEVVTPEKIVVDEQAQYVAAPGAEGEFGVLPGHTPFLTSLALGTLRYKTADGTERCVFINGGFAEALPNKVTILAQSAERRCDIDTSRAKEALDRAQQRLGTDQDEVDFERAKAAAGRAQQRLSLAETRVQTTLR